MGEELSISGGGCQCGCCGDVVEVTDPDQEREQLVQLRAQVDDRLAEIDADGS